MAHACAGIGGDLQGGTVAHAQQACAGDADRLGGADDLDGVLCGHTVVGGYSDADAARAQARDGPGGLVHLGVAGVGALEAQAAGDRAVQGDGHGCVHPFTHAQGDAGRGQGHHRGRGNDGDGLGGGCAVVGRGGDVYAADGDCGDAAVGGDLRDLGVVPGIADGADRLRIDGGGELVALAHAQDRGLRAEGHGFRLGEHGDPHAGGLAVEVLHRDGGLARGHAQNTVGVGVDRQNRGIAAAQAVVAHACAGIGGDLQGGTVAHAQQACAGDADRLGGADDLDGVLCGHTVVGGYSDADAARAQARDGPGGLVHLGVAGVGALEAQAAGDRAVQGDGHGCVHLLTHAEGDAGRGQGHRRGRGNDGDGLGGGYAVVGRGGDVDAADGDCGDAAVGGDLGDLGVVPGIGNGADRLRIHGGGELVALAYAQDRGLCAEGHGFRLREHGDLHAGGLAVEGFDGDGGFARSSGMQAAVLQPDDGFVADGVEHSMAVCAGIEACGQGRGIAHAQDGRACAELDAAGCAANGHLAAGAQSAGCGDGDGGAARAQACDGPGGLVHLDVAGVGAAPAQRIAQSCGRDRAAQRVGHGFTQADADAAGAQGDGRGFGHGDSDRRGCAYAAGGDDGFAGRYGGQRAAVDGGHAGIAAAPLDGVVLAVGIGGDEGEGIADRQFRTGFDGQLQQEARTRLRERLSAVGGRIRGDAQRIQLVCGEGRQIVCIRPGGIGQAFVRKTDLRRTAVRIRLRDIDHARAQRGQLRCAGRRRNAHGAAGGDVGIAAAELRRVCAQQARRCFRIFFIGIVGGGGFDRRIKRRFDGRPDGRLSRGFDRGLRRGRAFVGIGRSARIGAACGVGRRASIGRCALLRSGFAGLGGGCAVRLQVGLLGMGRTLCGCVGVRQAGDCKERFICNPSSGDEAQIIHRSQNEEQCQRNAKKSANAVFHMQSTFRMTIFPLLINYITSCKRMQ